MCCTPLCRRLQVVVVELCFRWCVNAHVSVDEHVSVKIDVNILPAHAICTSACSCTGTLPHVDVEEEAAVCAHPHEYLFQVCVSLFLNVQ